MGPEPERACGAAPLPSPPPLQVLDLGPEPERACGAAPLRPSPLPLQVLDLGPEPERACAGVSPPRSTNSPYANLGLAHELVLRVRLLCALGLSLILLRPRSKEPVRMSWAPAKQRCTSSDRLLSALGAQPEANLAIVCGAVSGLVVVDLDSPEAIARASAVLPATPLRTKTVQGEHWFYRHPPGEPVPSVCAVRPGIDVKGEGGYVVAPGSVHPTGAKYEALGDWNAPDAIAALPLFDRSWFKEPEPAKQSADELGEALGPRRDEEDDESYGRRMVRGIKEAVRRGALDLLRKK